ncbi:MAG: ferredoxin [Desulfobacterium sp.]|nr:ferredoxin [Desulfobacterium sp.]
MRKPTIEMGDCILCEICVEVCPQVFALNDLRYVAISDLENYPEECVDEAIRNCPADCISWEG